MRGQQHKWYQPAQLREQRRELEREGTRLLRTDRRRNNKPSNWEGSRQTAPVPSSALPRQLRLSDLPLLRPKGLIP